VFSRREKTATAEVVPEPTEGGGKGRATPKRRDAERERRERVKGPSDPKAARKLDRERAVQDRRDRQEGLLRGDERYLPKRDAGPRRRFIRDWVDARRTAAEMFLPAALVIVALGLVGASPAARALSFLIWVVTAFSIIVDTLIWIPKLRGQLATKFAAESRRGDILYALMRAMLVRRLRTPRAAVPRNPRKSRA
jgi:DUF3043 family protein